MSKKVKEEIVQTAPVEVKPIRLDFGCGKNKLVEAGKEWIGVDSMPFPGVDIVLDLTAKENSVQNPDFSVTHTYKAWPWADSSVDEIHASHFLEHLNGPERIHFCNEAYRVLKPGAQARIIVPHWASCRAYGDLTHQWPPISEFFWYYLDTNWRAVNAPHNVDYKCHFACSWGYSLNQALLVRNQEYQNFALANFKEAAQDTICTMTKVPMPEIK
jgi:predicted SAM-dependent methyltransferase